MGPASHGMEEDQSQGVCASWQYPIDHGSGWSLAPGIMVGGSYEQEGNHSVISHQNIGQGEHGKGQGNNSCSRTQMRVNKKLRKKCLSSS